MVKAGVRVLPTLLELLAVLNLISMLSLIGPSSLLAALVVLCWHGEVLLLDLPAICASMFAALKTGTPSKMFTAGFDVF